VSWGPSVDRYPLVNSKLERLPERCTVGLGGTPLEALEAYGLAGRRVIASFQQLDGVTVSSQVLSGDSQAIPGQGGIPVSSRLDPERSKPLRKQPPGGQGQSTIVAGEESGQWIARRVGQGE
jgi:hypothetical protein